MKRHFNKILVAALSALFLMAGCDKIAEDNHLIFSGAEGAWYDGNGVADKSQRAFLEKYTGPRCVNCPTADDAIHEAMLNYGDRMVVVAIHDSSYFCKPYEGSPDMRTDDGNTWSTFFGVKASGTYPMAMVNRKPAGSAFDLFSPTSGIEAKVDPVLAQSAKVAIAVDCQTAANEATITVNLEFLQDVQDALTLTLFVMEDGILATQSLPDGSHNESYVHNHILRDVITDPMGASVDATGKAGEKRMATFGYTLNSEAWNLANCHVVAFVSYAGTKEILNVAECEVE